MGLTLAGLVGCTQPQIEKLEDVKAEYVNLERIKLARDYINLGHKGWD